jgi:hypothetical protein
MRSFPHDPVLEDTATVQSDSSIAFMEMAASRRGLKGNGRVAIDTEPLVVEVAVALTAVGMRATGERASLCHEPS